MTLRAECPPFRMLDKTSRAPHVVMVGVDIDPMPQTPVALIRDWDDFGHLEAAAAGDGHFRVSIVQSSWCDERREVDGIPCHFVRESKPIVRLPNGRGVRPLPMRLCARIRGLAPDLVHFNGLGFSRELRLLRAFLPKVPVVAQAHTSAMPTGWKRWYFRWGVEGIDAALFCAHAQAQLFKNSRLLPAELPVFEAVEASSLFNSGDQHEAREATGLHGDPCLFWLGNLDANKDPIMVLDAVALAAFALPRLRLYMCFRHDSLLRAVRKRISSNPVLAERVELMGKLPHPAIEAHLRAADFFVQGSHREAAGIGVIEALACGTTPLVTDIPSFRWITDHGRYGALVQPGDSNALARAIVAWSQRTRATLRREARARFESHLSFDAMGRQLRDAYAQIMALR